MWSAQLKIVVAVVAFMALAKCCTAQHYQGQPALNWESVILSRNGPSTSTTRRPRVWSTTTLRSFGIAPLQGTGKASYEEAKIAVRPSRRRPGLSQSAESGSASLHISTTALCTIITLGLNALTRQLTC